MAITTFGLLMCFCLWFHDSGAVKHRVTVVDHSGSLNSLLNESVASNISAPIKFRNGAFVKDKSEPYSRYLCIAMRNKNMLVPIILQEDAKTHKKIVVFWDVGKQQQFTDGESLVREDDDFGLEIFRKGSKYYPEQTVWMTSNPLHLSQSELFHPLAAEAWKVHFSSVEVTEGPFKSRNVFVRGGARIQVNEAVDNLEKLEKQKSGSILSILVHIPAWHPSFGAIVQTVLNKGYKFHRFAKGTLVYYRWLGDPSHDMVPPWMSSSEGVGVCVLSPDGLQILLQYEHGHWKMVTGSVELGDSTIDTVHKETEEELGVELDPDKPLHFVGGFQSHRTVHENNRTGDRPTNIMLVFVASARSQEFKVDGVEITKAHWFPLSSIPKVDVLEGEKFFGSKPMVKSELTEGFLKGLSLTEEKKTAEQEKDKTPKVQLETAFFVSAFKKKRMGEYTPFAKQWVNTFPGERRDIFY